MKKRRKILLSNKFPCCENKKILIRYPTAFDIKKVCTPNMKIPTEPLSKPIYLAPFKPNDVLSITGKGNPYF